MKIQPTSSSILWTLVAIVLTPFVWILLFSSNDLSEVGLMQKNLAELRDRLYYAEALNQERENDVQNLRNQMKLLMGTHQHGNISEAGGRLLLPKVAHDLLMNMSYGSVDMSIPNMFHYLPHLIGKPGALRPAMKLSKGRTGVSIVIGIPTIKRERESYLDQTVQSLIDSLNDDEKNDCLIVIMISEKHDQEFIQRTIDNIKTRFSAALDSGILEVIVPQPLFYPDLSDLVNTFGDSDERMRWRTRQNLDYSYMMMYARVRGTYYVQLEDDVVTKFGYLTTMKDFVLSQKMNEWILLEFSHLGFIGKLFRSNDLPFVVEFVLMFYRDKPVDWLLDHLLYVKVCSPEKDMRHCQSAMDEVRRRYKPSLFQHIGTFSSLKGKVQKLKDKDFGKGEMHRPHVNPNAEVSTTIKIYEHFSLDRAYMGETFFWGLIPQQGDTVDFKFSPPIHIGKFLLRSGNAEHPGDKFFNTSIHVLSTTRTGKAGGSVENNNQTQAYRITNDGFYIIGQFDDDSGLAEETVPAWLGPIEVLRLHVDSTAASWVILSEKKRKGDGNKEIKTAGFMEINCCET